MIACKYYSKRYGKVEFVQLVPGGVWTFSNTGDSNIPPSRWIISCRCYKSLKNALAAFLMGYENNQDCVSLPKKEQICQK